MANNVGNGAPTPSGVNAVSQTLRDTLRKYIEAQYHIRDEDLIEERKALLEEQGTIYQRPYVEATPAYKIGRAYSEMAIPRRAQRVLEDLSKLDVGLYPRPYVHQGQALEAFLGRHEDVLVATGTGSGKTESFLMPIIGSLALESEERPASAKLPGCRAILLYPMNALVNDQLSRVRRIVGDPHASELISAGRGRPIRFATYTGRTPYPGRRSGSRDRNLLAPLFDEYYLPLLQNAKTVEILRNRGRWPSKDLTAFYNADVARKVPYRSGKRVGQEFLRQNWHLRFLTSPSDRELLTRDEVQRICPDILITNYSMLEYMLMRPIERIIFEQTKEWLQSDERNELILVIDEAHIYSGAAGAEVALLIRRLTARMGIPRSRLRCILTSASIGNDESVDSGRVFAVNLTGGTEQTTVALIKGTLEDRAGSEAASETVGAALAECSIEKVEGFAADEDAAISELLAIFRKLRWQHPTSPNDLDLVRDALFENLTGFGPAELLLQLTSGSTIKLDNLAMVLFSGQPETTQSKATAALLALCSFAKRASDGRVFLPTRLHLFFRGLPGIFGCIDANCSHKRVESATGPLGRLYAEPRLTCECASAARVYELFTHRDCGSAFVQGYISGWSGSFLWSEPSRAVGERFISPLSPIHLLVDGKPHPEDHEWRMGYLDISSGRIFWDEPKSLDGFREVYAAASYNDGDLCFKKCPVCLKRWRGEASKIMDHQTKGEDPFAAIVTAQLYNQAATEKVSRERPNGGRKVLLFSDGRQKAARLARDIPRACEQDVFRAALALAVLRMNKLAMEAKPDTNLYVSFLSVLIDSNVIMFDGTDRTLLEQHMESLTNEGFDNLTEALTEFSPSVTPPERYTRMLLSQLCSQFYSISGVTIGYVAPTQRQLRRIANLAVERNLLVQESADLEPLIVAWIQGLLTSFSFGPAIPEHLRRLAAGYTHWPWGSKGKFAREFRRSLINRDDWSEAEVAKLEQLFSESLALPKDEEGLFLEIGRLALVIDLKKKWLQCEGCTALSPLSFRGCCLQCGHTRIKELDPATSAYLVARKGYWRAPIESLIAGSSNLQNASVEEHTAQLSHRDRGNAYSTTESYELRFQDILINKKDRPIDILSCTTTMEVGIDIGQLVAVGLRNVPPQRSNYQQRAGRAGRRGSSVSTVVTYAQNGPHDSYYFNDPRDIISGTPKTPDLKVDNPKIARRHIHAYLLQTYFNEAIDKGELILNGDTSSLFKALGRTSEFFHGIGANRVGLENFSEWIKKRIIETQADLVGGIATWLPDTLKISPLKKSQWIRKVAEEFITDLNRLKSVALLPASSTKLAEPNGNDDSDEDPYDKSPLLQKEQLLDFLFDNNLLPSYAFPTNLSGFLVEQFKKVDYGVEVRVKEQPQQSMDKALSEYAPGRLVVINKETYRSGGLIANVPASVLDRAAPLFRPDSLTKLVFCTACSFVRDADAEELEACKICGNKLEVHDALQPELFTPEKGRSLRDDDRDQDITYATMAQFPVPLDEDEVFADIGVHARSTYTTDKRLLIVNKGIRTRDGFSGFNVCDKCGSASPEPREDGMHERPYKVATRGSGRAPRCSGTFRNLYIGTVFKSDVLLLRFRAEDPILHDTRQANALFTLEDALITISQAISLAAARHPELDIDPRELGGGYRIIPERSGAGQTLDVYLYDTSAGGAGYSEMAGKYINDILLSTIEFLENCPARCDRSCQNCLRHFHNQHIQDRLDRFLGAQLLKYVLYGDVPAMQPAHEQAGRLKPLKRYLELEGYQCQLGVDVHGVTVPLLVSLGDEQLAVALRPALLMEGTPEVSRWEADLASNGIAAVGISDFLLLRDLPDVHRIIAGRFRAVRA